MIRMLSLVHTKNFGFIPLKDKNLYDGLNYGIKISSGNNALSGHVVLSSGSSSTGTSGNVFIESGNSAKGGDIRIRVGGLQAGSEESYGLELDGGQKTSLHAKNVAVSSDSSGGTVAVSSMDVTDGTSGGVLSTTGTFFLII